MFLVQPLDPSSGAPQPFLSVISRREWLFALTDGPNQNVIIWRTDGVAFHCLSLVQLAAVCCPGRSFSTFDVASDLLAITLCDDYWDLWVLDLEQYFETDANVDWDLVEDQNS